MTHTPYVGEVGHRRLRAKHSAAYDPDVGRKSNAVIRKPLHRCWETTPRAPGETAYDHHDVGIGSGSTTTERALVDGRKVTKRPIIGRGGKT